MIDDLYLKIETIGLVSLCLPVKFDMKPLYPLVNTSIVPNSQKDYAVFITEGLTESAQNLT